MNDIDRLIRQHMQALTTAQAAKIMQLEREKTELQQKVNAMEKRITEHEAKQKVEVQA